MNAWQSIVRFTNLFLEKHVIDPSCESAQNDIIRGSTGQVKPSPQMSDYYLELTETQYSNIDEN